MDDLRPANELVNLAVAKVGENLDELPTRKKPDARRRVAEALGYSGDAQQKVYRWRATGPKYRDTIALLDLCGFITPEGRAFLRLGDRVRVEAAVELATETAADLRRRGRGGRREAAS